MWGEVGKRKLALEHSTQAAALAAADLRRARLSACVRIGWQQHGTARRALQRMRVRVQSELGHELAHLHGGRQQRVGAGNINRCCKQGKCADAMRIKGACGRVLLVLVPARPPWRGHRHRRWTGQPCRPTAPPPSHAASTALELAGGRAFGGSHQERRAMLVRCKETRSVKEKQRSRRGPLLATRSC